MINQGTKWTKGGEGRDGGGRKGRRRGEVGREGGRERERERGPVKMAPRNCFKVMPERETKPPIPDTCQKPYSLAATP